MPNIQKQFLLEVTPEQFLNACSPSELMELEVLIAAPRYQAMMKHPEGPMLPIINPETTAADECAYDDH
ncbi:hypothetical protein [Flavobacterium beibuense]|uniref:hypothetical protein n=1 Tax=Flavobacterium beibuense TaxID=657326 RepID=UPI003A8DFBC2